MRILVVGQGGGFGCRYSGFGFAAYKKFSNITSFLKPCLTTKPAAQTLNLDTVFTATFPTASSFPHYEPVQIHQYKA